MRSDRVWRGNIKRTGSKPVSHNPFHPSLHLKPSVILVDAHSGFHDDTNE